MKDLYSFLDELSQHSSFNAELSKRGGFITFSNSGKRGEIKYFQIGLDSILQTLKDILDNLNVFNTITEYEEKAWRDKGSGFFNDPVANANSTVQTKPLFSTLSKVIIWGNQPRLNDINPDKTIVLDEFSLKTAIKELERVADSFRPKQLIQKATNQSLQQIFYGAPGTGKSHKVNETTQIQPKENVFRTTFHPDSDYATFVGGYKPTKEVTNPLSLHKLHELYPEFKTKVENRPLHRFITKHYNSFRLLTEKEAESVFDKIETSSTVTAEVPKIMAAIEEIPTISSISYSFVPQTFTKAYLRAWQTEEPVFLVIEEINRGNCAQIFGDLFQLLDRKNGVSEYPIKADNDLATFIGEQLSGSTRVDIPGSVKSGEELILPSNLYIWATMNTSDQSLFPIDSAFKRRWEWKYIKIKKGKDENGYELDWKIVVKDKDGNIVKINNEESLSWWDFISKINEIISSITSSADKQLGYFFCKADSDGVIGAETFVSKVIFYLWNDVFKDYGFEDASLFQYKETIDGKEVTKDLTFPDFYDEEGEKVNDVRLKGFLESVMNWKKEERRA